MSKNKNSFFNIGASSLLVIFFVLCLTVFAALSLSSAKNDYTLAEEMAGRTTDYYAASNEAEEIVAEIDALLSLGEPLDSYHRNDIELEIDGNIATFLIPVNDDQGLYVALDMTPKGSHYYEINEWKVIATTKWSGDDTMNLIQVGE